ncbi:metallophosphoesterase family protein, partial [Chloroflexota bacterium]
WPMKIGVMSDSHGNIDYVRQAAEYMMDAEIDGIIHLGDDYQDARVLDNLPATVLKVPGVYDDVYQDATVPNRLLESISGLRVLITHTRGSNPNDLPQDEKPEECIAGKKVDIILHGHSHSSCARMEKSVLVINPGHLTAEGKKGEATFALVAISNRHVDVEIVNMKGETRSQAGFDL